MIFVAHNSSADCSMGGFVMAFTNLLWTSTKWTTDRRFTGVAEVWDRGQLWRRYSWLIRPRYCYRLGIFTAMLEFLDAPAAVKLDGSGSWGWDSNRVEGQQHPRWTGAGAEWWGQWCWRRNFGFTEDCFAFLVWMGNLSGMSHLCQQQANLDVALLLQFGR